MLEEIREYCLQKTNVTECLPFDENTLVLKLHNKIFALIRLEKDPLHITLKCNPNKALDLREKYTQILPGYHSNKKHWNTIVVENISLALLYKWIDDSYQLVWNDLPKKLKP